MLKYFLFAMVLTVVSAPLLPGESVPTSTLKPETVQAFERYVAATEARLAHAERMGRFLWADQSAERLKRVRKGAVVVENWNGGREVEVPDGLIHDWVGAAFIPKATLKEVIALAQNYNQHEKIYRPEVLDARLLRRSGNTFDVYLRLLKKKVITVVLNTEHRVEYTPINDSRWKSRSYSTKIAEVQDAGEPGESELMPGAGHGFLWRLNSYWRFQERDGGVYIECQAISLTRDIPTGLGWLIGPITRNLPKDSLEDTLASTRNALRK